MRSKHQAAAYRVGRWCLAVVWAGVVVSLLVARPARATVVVSKDLSQLSAEADLIFVGTVADVRSQWVDPEQQHIETLVTFASIEPLWGVDTDTVTLRFSGGQIGATVQQVVGIPRFTPGERVVVFAREGHFVSPIVGFHQGCFHVVRGSTGPLVVDAPSRPSGTSAALMAEGATTGGGVGGVPLDAFLDEVRAELAKRQTGQP
jgi:hypothetical protein